MYDLRAEEALRNAAVRGVHDRERPDGTRNRVIRYRVHGDDGRFGVVVEGNVFVDYDSGAAGQNRFDLDVVFFSDPNEARALPVVNASQCRRAVNPDVYGRRVG